MDLSHPSLWPEPAGIGQREVQLWGQASLGLAHLGLSHISAPALRFRANFPSLFLAGAPRLSSEMMPGAVLSVFISEPPLFLCLPRGMVSTDNTKMLPIPDLHLNTETFSLGMALHCGKMDLAQIPLWPTQVFSTLWQE